MRTTFKILSILAVLGLFISCSNDKNDELITYEPLQSAATLMTLSDGSRILQLDQDNVLKASNMKEFAQKPDGRVIITYEDHGQIVAPIGNKCTWHLGKITKFDPIVTSKPAEISANVVSNDRIEVLLDNPMTCVQDGYLTIAYEVGSGDKNIKHNFTLKKTDSPLVFQLHHDNNGDISSSEVKEGVVAFDLKDLLPTNGETHKVLIKYMGFSTAKTISIIFMDGRYKAPTKLLTHETPMECFAC